MERDVKVSVVIATYCPGEAVRRVIDSLDAQTLPQDEFEVIYVDDGSPDDTVERLRGFAETRANMHVHRIENSGWPSRPRNVGIELARGEYVFFMDHDDSLYPDGLRRAYEYAVENDADILSPKESKTNDVWWGSSSLTAGNIPNVLLENGVGRLMPMVPHKLYRLRLLLEHGIRFPEGARVLWEDWFINLGAYRRAKTVSVLADTPVYLWHASSTNSSHTFSPSRVDFWDRLADLMAYVRSSFDGPDDLGTRNVLLAHHVRTRVIDRCVRLTADPNPALLQVKRMALRRAQQLLARFVSDEVAALLPKKHQAQLYLIHGGDPAAITSFHRADLALGASTTAVDTRWEDGRIAYETLTRWRPRAADSPGFELRDGRLLRVVEPSVARALPPELLDHTEDARRLVVELALRSRAEHITWQLPYEHDEPEFTRDESGVLVLQQRGSGAVDLASASFGRRLDDTVFDVRTRTEWIGMERKGALEYAGAPLPVLMHGRGGVAYRNASRGLSLDLQGRLRTLPADARPTGDGGPVGSFAVDLENVTVFGSTELDASTLVAVAEPEPGAGAGGREEPDGASAAEGDAEEQGPTTVGLSARVVARDGAARLEGGAALGPGRYVLHAWRDNELHRTTRVLVVDPGLTTSFAELESRQPEIRSA